LIPIGDDNTSRVFPLINWSIIIACIAVFFWQNSGDMNFFSWTISTFGLIPSKILQRENLHSIITNIFLHGGWAHLLGNMLFLFIFGDNIESRFGHIRYLFFYLICGVMASMIWMITDLFSPYPAVGASGAISAVLGAYFVLYPRNRIRTLMTFGIFIRVIRIPAWIMIGFWFLYQLLLGFIPYNTGIAYWAHIGGFVTGFIFSRFFKADSRRR
jgi:membrane associated rhomboid family serine protease